MSADRIPEGTLERLIDKYGDADQHATLQQITGARPHAIKRGDEGVDASEHAPTARIHPEQIVAIGGSRYRVVLTEGAPGYSLRYLGPIGNWPRTER